MKLAVVTPCLYPNTDRIHFLRDSAAKLGVPIHTLGLGQQFADWRQMTLGVMVPGMTALLQDGYTHALYLDGVDTILLADVEEIAEKYRQLGSPVLLFSAQRVVYPDYPFNWYAGMWRFPNAGCCIASITHWCVLMARLAEKYPDDGNPQSWLVRGWVKEHADIDNACNIFQTMDGTQSVRVYPGMVVNRVTGTFPCVLHFPGGYVDPANGRDERIYPYWRHLYGE